MRDRSFEEELARQAKYRRARIRNFLFTSGPNRLTGGRISRRHLAQDVCVREIETASPLWPKAFDGMRIGHVSDFHLGELLPLPRALEIVERLRSQEPDLVACTGDLVDLHHHGAAPLLDALAAIDARFGSWLVLGNHDELDSPEMLSEMAKRAGVLPLHNEAVELHQPSRNGDTHDSLVLAGIDWAKSASGCAKHVEIACGGPNGFAHLLLAHNPKAFTRAAELDVPLTLAGHTHGGQVAMKKRPRANLAFTHRHSAGLFAKGISKLFVTTGIGAWFPLRVNCPAEIVILTMRHDPDG